MPSVTGRAGELLFVVEDVIWKSSTGDTIKKYFAADCPGIVNTEPLFDLVQIPSSAFDKMLHTHRCIMFVKISDDVEKNKISAKKDVWAKMQTVVNVEAKNKEEINLLLHENREMLVDLFLESERNIAIQNNIEYEELAVTDKLKQKHKLTMYIPKGCVISMDSANFVWISQTMREAELGLLVYYYPYTDTSAFSPYNLIDKRDAVLRTKVQGGIEGSYMSTDRNIPIDYRELNYKDKYAVEIRGWWETTGRQFWGGPFLSLSTVDEQRNRIVTVEGFVFAPNKEKRNLLRKVESMIYSLKFVEENQTK